MAEKLVYAVPADLGSGAAHCVHVVKMGAALRRLGLDVDVCVKAAPPESILAQRYGLADEFRVTRVLLPGPGPTSLRFARGTLARANQGARVLTRNLMTACLTSWSGHPTLLELHSPVDTIRERVLFRYFLRSRGSVGLITITEALKARFIEDFGPAVATRIHVLPDAADPVPLREPVVISPPTVGYVGTFLPGKGADLVLRIAAMMPEVDFVLIGGGAENLPADTYPTNVRLLGRLPHTEAIQWMTRFDIALLPNQARVLVSGGKVDIGRWTSPLKMFEYMSARLPIVASRLPVLQEVLTDRRNALLASPEDPREWALRIRSLLNDRAMAADLAARAHQDFLDRYSWDGRARRISEILDSNERH